MPKGEEFSAELKKVFFRVFEFVEAEKHGPIIPLSSVHARIMALLGIGERSVERLKIELQELRQVEENKIEQEVEDFSLQATPPQTRFQSVTTVASSGHRKKKRKWSAAKLAESAFITNIPTPLPPQKRGNVGRHRLVLSEMAEDAIRYHFHLILVRINLTYSALCSCKFYLKGRTTLSDSRQRPCKPPR